MTPKRSLDSKEIIDLLSKLKEETPEYPAQMMEARKAAFLKQAANLRIPGEGNGGEGSSDAGGSGSGGTGGGAAFQGIVLQALIAVSVIGALIATAFAYREQISDIVQGNEVVAVEDISAPFTVSTPTPFATATPVPSGTSTVETPTMETLTGTPTGPGYVILIDGKPVVVITLPENGTPYILVEVLDGSKTNSGLHLGQTPGTPAAPGQGNPGNENQPDKPDNPDKPDKPTKAPKEDNPNKPDKPE